MNQNPSSPAVWSELELRMLNTTDVFIHKPGIIKKTEEKLEALRLAMSQSLVDHPLPCPEGTDTSKGQIAKGENHKGFPFVSLDLPQHFNKQEFFTYRVLFWWGHYLGYSLILKGPNLDNYQDQIISKNNAETYRDILFALNPSPWEWSVQPAYFKTLSELSEEEIRDTVQANQYIKLMRVFPMGDAGFSDLDWIGQGIQNYSDFNHLVHA